MGTLFVDRADAARQLSAVLRPILTSDDASDVVIVGLPRGGVTVAATIARILGVAHDLIVVRKLGVPHHRELAMGAIGEGRVRVLNDELITRLGVTATEIAHVEAEERAELDRRVAVFRAGRPALRLVDRVVVVTDDGLATGASARAACQVARAAGARSVILAVPVAPPGWTEMLHGVADAFVAVATPARFAAVGQFYDDFGEVSDAEVVEALGDAG